MRRTGKAYLIDANVLLRFLLGDDAAQSPRAHALMKQLEEAKSVAELEDIALAETVWVLEKRARVPRSEIARSLSNVILFEGLRYRGKRIALGALSRFSATNCDIADCLLAARARSRGAGVWTFDEDFRKLSCTWEAP